jgi:hypothetical protein
MDVHEGHRHEAAGLEGRHRALDACPTRQRLAAGVIQRDRDIVDALRMSTVLARPEGQATSRPQGVYGDALLHLAALSIVAGSIHAVAAPSHFSEAWTHGGFFVILAAFQLGWGALIYSRPWSRGLRTGIAVNVAVIAVWIASRTVGVPFGPEAWHPEAPGTLDVGATATEAMIALMGQALLASGGRSPTDAVLPLPARYLRPLVYAQLVLALLAVFVGGGHHTH